VTDQVDFDEPGHILAPLRPGADRDLGLEQGAGLGVCTSPREQFGPLGGKVVIDAGGRHGDQGSGVCVAQGDLAVTSQQRDDGGQHRDQAFAGRRAGQHPADGESGHHVGTELRGPCRPWPSNLECPGPPDGGPAVVAMPSGQLDQFVNSSRIRDFSGLDPRL
jgi:hypothetical protein